MLYRIGRMGQALMRPFNMSRSSSSCPRCIVLTPCHFCTCLGSWISLACSEACISNAPGLMGCKWNDYHMDGWMTDIWMH